MLPLLFPLYLYYQYMFVLTSTVSSVCLRLHTLHWLTTTTSMRAMTQDEVQHNLVEKSINQRPCVVANTDIQKKHYINTHTLQFIWHFQRKSMQTYDIFSVQLCKHDIFSVKLCKLMTFSVQNYTNLLPNRCYAGATNLWQNGCYF